MTPPRIASLLTKSLVALLLLAPFVEAGEPPAPTLTINGVTAMDNSAMPHAMKLKPITIELTGTPGAPFALLLSGDAFEGSIGEEPIEQGFFLKPWAAPPVFDSPIHPVFDGIGSAFIRDQLVAQGDATLDPDDILADTPSPVFRFDASGKFALTSITPPFAFLKNYLPGPKPFGDPIVVPLESTPTQTIKLFLQVVELDVATLEIVSGNGVTLVFDQSELGGAVGYSVGEDNDQSSVTVANMQTIGTIFDFDFTDEFLFTPNAAPDFSGDAEGNIDLWRITLSEVHHLTDQSLTPVGANGLVQQPDVDSTVAINEQHEYASGMEFLSRSEPALNNENIEYPRISLPGDRELFHWRNAHDDPPGSGPTYGFAVYFRESGTFKIVSPAEVGEAARSPWEVEVGVTPDGNRALVVLDRLTNEIDRVFMLNLEEGPDGLFKNGLPYHDLTPTSGLLIPFFNRVFEESIVFTTSNTGEWVGFFCSSSDTSSSLSVYPNRMWRVGMDDSGTDAFPESNTVNQVIPGPPPDNIYTRIDRQPIVSPDRTALAVGVGTSASNEQILAVTAINSGIFGSHALDNVTQHPSATQILETGDTIDGNAGVMTFSPDGSLIAYCRLDGSRQIPVVVRTDTQGAGLQKDLIADLVDGGLFDMVDFQLGRDYYITPDNSHILFYQGRTLTSVTPDRFDLFSINLNTNLTINRTATLASSTNIFGPYSAANDAFDRPTIDPAGYFLSPDGDTYYFLRDGRGLLGITDRMNIVAVDVGSPAPGVEPTLDLINVTGTEFPAQPGGTPPVAGAPDIIGDGTPSKEGTGEYYGLRRIGGDGPFANFAFFKARIAGSVQIDQLFLIDLDNPSPALQLTDFGIGKGQIPVQNQARITSVTPSADGTLVAFTLDEDGAGFGSSTLQDLVLLDLTDFGKLKRIPDNAVPFERLITAGTVRYADTSPPGLLYVSGSVPRGPGSLDGVTVSEDITNPIDAMPFFHRFDQPEDVFAIQPPPSPGPQGLNRRAAFIFGVSTE